MCRTLLFTLNILRAAGDLALHVEEGGDLTEISQLPETGDRSQRTSRSVFVNLFLGGLILTLDEENKNDIKFNSLQSEKTEVSIIKYFTFVNISKF